MQVGPCVMCRLVCAFRSIVRGRSVAESLSNSGMLFTARLKGHYTNTAVAMLGALVVVTVMSADRAVIGQCAGEPAR
jgi:hypothetical protein